MLRLAQRGRITLDPSASRAMGHVDVDVVVVAIVDLDGNGDVNLAGRALTRLLARSSTLSGNVRVAVAVATKVRDDVHDQVNANVGCGGMAVIAVKCQSPAPCGSRRSRSRTR